MLISCVPETDSECRDNDSNLAARVDSEHRQEYQTPDELFEIMAMTTNFDAKDEEVLTHGDLVLLYQNMDLGTQLMANTNEFHCKRSNQYFETVIYQGDEEPSSSDISQINSNDDIHNLFLINSGRIDILNSASSIEETLCQKYGCIELQQSKSTEYDKHFLFHDPYIKEQLNSLKCISNEVENSVFPASLLDYICCKRLEDNCTFYMDNVIKYVKNTIDQLKRISNGDYLTDKAKEKWCEVEEKKKIEHEFRRSSKVLTNTTSIPLHIEQKTTKHVTTWDDIVHSEVDLRSLCKILEKKVIIEIPKLITGSYELFSNCCTDSLIIKCKKKDSTFKAPIVCPNLDVVFQLKRSNSGRLLSDISSIMIMQKSASPVIRETSYSAEILSLPYRESEETQCNSVQIPDVQQNLGSNCGVLDDNSCKLVQECLPSESGATFYHTTNNSDKYESARERIVNDDEVFDNINSSQDCVPCQVNHFTNTDLPQGLNTLNMETTTPGDLMVSIQKLQLQCSLPEENEDIMQSPTPTPTPIKRRSTTNVKNRIKSPYENKSHCLDEKKRKRLLEIREKREKRKMALSENCKITRSKYGKGVALPQTSSSVTKLSITNKSFYNSIFGHKSNMLKNCKLDAYNKQQKKSIGDDISNEIIDEIKCDTEDFVQDMTNQNDNNYLDATMTAVMCLEIKDQNSNTNSDFSMSNSVGIVKDDNNSNLLSQLQSFDTGIATHSKINRVDGLLNNNRNNKHRVSFTENNAKNYPKQNIGRDSGISKSVIASLECRKNIDKIYNLMETLSKKDVENYEKGNIQNNNTEKLCQESSTVQGSDSGTSVKHHLTSSNPSSFSFEKITIDKPQESTIKKRYSPVSVIPKVVISTKLHATNQQHFDKGKILQKDRKYMPINKTNANNPLKAISHILHEFENVQKTKLKGLDDTKVKSPVKSDVRYISKQVTNRNIIRREQCNNERLRTPPSRKNSASKDGKERPSNLSLTTRLDKFNMKHGDRISKNNISDIIDEAKEARGEAVRGPSKNNASRIHALAQPKRMYVQAHSEEFQNKHGRNLMADRLQRLASTQQSLVEKSNNSIQAKAKAKRSGSENVSPVTIKSLEKPLKNTTKRSRNVSPESNRLSSSAIKEPPGSPPSKKNIILARSQELRNMRRLQIKSSDDKNFNQELASPLNTECTYVKKSRVPLVPNDLEFGSNPSSSPTEEASTLGVKLHRIVNSMLKTNSSGLTDLPEFSESIETAISDRNKFHEEDNLFEVVNLISSNKEKLNNFNDVQTIEIMSKIDSDRENHILKSTINILSDHLKNAEKEFSQTTSKTVISNTHIKNSPQASLTMQNTGGSKAGDGNSVVAVKLSLSETLKTSKFKDISESKLTQSNSKSRILWPFAQYPFQVTTVGYAFPRFAIISPNKSIPKIQTLEKRNVSDIGVINKMDRPTQFIEVPNAKNEQALQTNINSLNVMLPKGLQGEQCQNEFCQTEKNSVTTIPKSQNEVKSRDTATDSISGFNTMDGTNSLDILVNLLNEIQNITTCQTEMTNTEQEEGEYNDMATNKKSFKNIFKPEILGKSICRDIISISSLDKMRYLDSHTSMYSFYVSNDGDLQEPIIMREVIPKFKTKNVSCNVIPLFSEDKEVTADIGNRDCINRYTDVPSQILPITVNHGTNVTNSLIGIFSQPSSQSIFKYDHNYESIFINTALNTPKKVIEISTSPKIQQTVDKKALPKIKCGNVKVDSNVVEIVKYVEKEKTIHDFSYIRSDIDPVMKMKRDILVTVYSVLVFTVFAALSFPEFLHQSV